MANTNENSASLVIYSPVLGDFLIKNPKSDAALEAARLAITDVEWKKGYTPEKSQQVKAMLAKDGVHPVVVAGAIKRIYADKTGDTQGNTYEKVRIIVEDPLETMLLSLEAGAEVTLIILQALCNAQPGEMVTFAPWQEVATRGNRSYYNHRCKIKRNDGTIVAQLAGAWKQAQDAADKATADLRALNNATLKGAINNLAASAKMQFHLGLLRDVIAPRFQN